MSEQAAAFVPATDEDVEPLLELMRELYVLDGTPFDAAWHRASLAPLLADGSLGRVWLARAGGEPAGYLVVTFGYSLEFGGHDAFVDELYLREGYRRAGLGRAAIATAMEACREMGVQALHLEVERTNVAAQGFYRRLGFHDHDRYLLTRWIGTE